MIASQASSVDSSRPVVGSWARLLAGAVARTPMAFVLLLASWTFFTWIIAHLQTATGTLEPMYGDHFRHVRYVLNLPQLGFGIYSTAARELVVSPVLPPPVWGNLTYLYPPGALVVFVPLAAALSAGVAPALATKWFLLFLVTVTHVSAYVLNRTLASREGSAGLRGMMVALFTLTATFWSLNGQYDVVPAFFIILSGAAPSSTKSFVWAAVAISLKFQSLLILPFVAWRGFAEWKAGRLERPSRGVAVLLAVLVGLTGVAMILLRNDLAPIYQNRMSWHDASGHSLVAGIMTAWVVGFALLNRNFAEALTIALTYVALAKSAVFQQWYLILILALIAHYRRPGRWELFAMWYAGLVLSTLWWPNPFRFWALMFPA